MSIWRAGVAAVDAAHLVQSQLALESRAGQRYLRLGSFESPRVLLPLDAIDRIVVVGGGKAGAGMVAGVEAALQDFVAERLARHPAQQPLVGWLNVPADCVRPTRWITLHAARPAGVNEPTAEGVVGSERMLELVGSLGPRDLCVALISGGGSALMPAPLDGITLADKQQITRHLSAAGANIQQLNMVRQRLSRLKGGGLARACRAARLWSLIISDVLGDPLDIIASGATVSTTNSASRALEILEQFRAAEGGVGAHLFERLRQQQRQERLAGPLAGGALASGALASGVGGLADWTTASGCEVRNLVIGNNALAVAAAVEEARRRGYLVTSHAATQLEGAAEEIGRSLVEQFAVLRGSGRGAVHISGGEPVVRLVPAAQRGLGGRNQQLVLAAVECWQRAEQQDESRRLAPGMVLLSGGTDGEDGPTDAAGALVDASILRAAGERQLEAADFLRRNDAYHFFEPLGGLIKTGPTHTNVCDLRVALSGPPRRAP